MFNLSDSANINNREINVSLLYSLFEWLSFPKNSKDNQNQLIARIESLMELEDNQKIKYECLKEHIDAVELLRKVVGFAYSLINTWRERTPLKSEDLAYWNLNLIQRITIYDSFLKVKLADYFENVVKMGNNSNSNSNIPTDHDKLLQPYSDIEWNKLKIIKQRRKFNIFGTGFDNLGTINTNNLGPDELFLLRKEQFY